MSASDAFYSHFPSLNSNSKENQRYKRISSEYSDYLKNLKPISPKPTKQQQMRAQRENDHSPSPSDMSGSSMDVIFSAEERNRVEDEQKELKRKSYQISLQRQIEEKRLEKLKDAERQKRNEIVLEKRLQKQLENIKLQKDPLGEKVFERISMSENEKETYNKPKVARHNTSLDNQVYRYFSQSAKVDSDLFNYQKYFSDVNNSRERFGVDFPEAKTAAKPNEVALKHDGAKNNPQKPQILAEINNSCCSNCSNHGECIRCHKKLEMYCKECNEHDKLSTEATNQLQIEYNERELPFSGDQQVVVYRPSDQHAPYSFNIEPGSRFYKDTLEDMRAYSEMKIANYIKLYGGLRKKKAEDEATKPTGAIPKLRSTMIRPKNLTLTPTHQSDLDEILSNAQYTMITQIGFAKRQIELDKLKL